MLGTPEKYRYEIPGACFYATLLGGIDTRPEVREDAPTFNNPTGIST